jgi:hypothetical protein
VVHQQTPGYCLLLLVHCYLIVAAQLEGPHMPLQMAICAPKAAIAARLVHLCCWKLLSILLLLLFLLLSLY